MLSDSGGTDGEKGKIGKGKNGGDFLSRIRSGFGRFYFCGKNLKPLVFLTFLQIRLKLLATYSIIFKTIKSNRIQEIVI